METETLRNDPHAVHRTIPLLIAIAEAVEELQDAVCGSRPNSMFVEGCDRDTHHDDCPVQRARDKLTSLNDQRIALL